MRVVLPLLLVALSGCIGAILGDDPSLQEVADDVEAAGLPLLVQDHGSAEGHHQASLHAGQMNVELVGYHNGVDNSGDPDAIAPDVYYTELAVTEQYVLLARQGAAGGFVIIDTSDPEFPHFVGAFDALGGADIEVNQDRTLAFFATQRNTVEEVAGGTVEDQDPSSNAPRGIYVVDIRDKGDPRLANFMPLPANGPHTLTYVMHPDGNEYLVACTYDFLVAGDPQQGIAPVTQRVILYRIEEDPTGALGPGLVPVGQYQITDRAPSGRLFMPHDATFQVHPETGSPLLYVAYWDKGVQILDISNPSNPTPVGSWNEFAPSTRNNIHQVRPFDEEIDGMHVTVAEPEIISADETGYMTFLDTSEPSTPRKLGSWTLPGDLFVQLLEFSPHNFDTWDGKVALAHNHAGVWILEAGSAEALAAPQSVGFYMPAMERENSPVMQPRVWGVFEQDGLLYVSDEATGLYVLRYTGP